MRQLKKEELRHVSGAGGGCPAPSTRGNPGNYKPVGNAGEKGGKFTSGSDTIGGNGRAGASDA